MTERSVTLISLRVKVKVKVSWRSFGADCVKGKFYLRFILLKFTFNQSRIKKELRKKLNYNSVYANRKVKQK